jgi:hypothetical protein
VRHHEGWGKMRKLIILASALVLGSVQAGDSLKRQMTDHLRAVGSVLRASYAPAEWKKKHFGWDLDVEIEKNVAVIENSTKITTKDYQKLLKGFFYGMKDYHVGFSFLSTESAVLPFTVKGAQGRYFLAHIDRNRLSMDSFPFQIGDELVTFGGKNVADVLVELRKELTQSSSETDAALSELMLTRRSARTAMSVPKGSLILGIKPKGSTKLRHIQVSWLYTPEKVNPLKTFGGNTFIHICSLIWKN